VRECLPEAVPWPPPPREPSPLSPILRATLTLPTLGPRRERAKRWAPPSPTSGRGAFGALLLCLILSACAGDFTPYQTVPDTALELPPGPRDPLFSLADPLPPERPRISLCHSGLVSGRAELDRYAKAACDTEGAPSYIGGDLDFDHCPLLTPSRATYTCPEK